MGSPTIFSGTRTKVLTSKGLLLSDGTVIDNDGQINYIKRGRAEIGTNGWATYADAAGTSPVDGTGGSPNITWTRSTSTPLRGAASYLMTKDAANRQGEGVSYDFTIDEADKTKVLQCSFDYAIASGTFADDDVTVWIYDVTNSVVIQPAPYKLKNHSTAAEKFSVEFQATTSTSYRLIIHVGSTSASAYTLKFDNFILGPQAKLYGSPVTEPVSYTPTFTGFGTVSTHNIKWWRVGKYLYVDGTFVVGTATSTEARVSFPSGLTAASTLPTISVAGIASRSSTTTNTFYLTKEASQSYFTFSLNGGSGSLTKINGDNITSSVTVSINGKVEIEGWGSQVVMSNDADTRVVAAKYYNSAAQTSLNNTDVTVQYNTKVYDTHNAFNTSTYTYTVPVPGYYRVSALVRFQNMTGTVYGRVRILKNGSTSTEHYHYNQTSTEWTQYAYDVISCVAGNTITVTAGSNDTAFDVATSSTQSYVIVERVSGPSQIAASETIKARYTSNSGQSIANSGDQIIDYEDVVTDSHGSVTTGASWKFTAQVSGTFEVSAAAGFASSAYSAGNRVFLYLFKNGSLYSIIDRMAFQASVTDVALVNGKDTIDLIAGDYIDIRVNNNRTAGSTSMNTGTGYNYIAIKKVGI